MGGSFRSVISSFDLSWGRREQLVVVILTTQPELGSPWVLSLRLLLEALP